MPLVVSIILNTITPRSDKLVTSPHNICSLSSKQVTYQVEVI